MFAVIPENYLETGVVPICISRVDRTGQPVFQGWIDAVLNVADPLRRLAKKELGDIWRVSELTEASVHQLASRHGETLGPAPSSAIYRDASWRAKDLRAGGRRERTGLNIQMRDEFLALLRTQGEFPELTERADFIDKVRSEAERLGQDDVVLWMNMMLAEAEDQIPGRFGIESKATTAWQSLSKRFLRGIRRAANSL